VTLDNPTLQQARSELQVDQEFLTRYNRPGPRYTSYPTAPVWNDAFGPDDLEQVRAFVDIHGIDVIMLDNMTPAQIREAIALRKDSIEFEASGGITLKNVNRFAATGVDYISVGSLTHAARAIDIGLEMTHVPG